MHYSSAYCTKKSSQQTCPPLLETILRYFLACFVVFFSISWKLFGFSWHFADIFWIIFWWLSDLKLKIRIFFRFIWLRHNEVIGKFENCTPSITGDSEIIKSKSSSNNDCTRILGGIPSRLLFRKCACHPTLVNAA